jgi:hypothetical protein
LGTFDAHASSDWQISTDSTFVAANFASLTASTTNRMSWTVTGLSTSTTYYARVRYTGSTNGTSAYSEVWNITTIGQFSSVIATPTQIPPAIGAIFEGGYYYGLIWNELVQSATSFAIGTGQKTFVVPDMTAVPLVYIGQTVEVRSRANPANKMTATVDQAGSTNLVLNVSSVAGSGTFSDWSIMSRYRLIIAPKSTQTFVAYNNTNSTVSGAITVSEGRKATLAMVAAGANTVYPAAYYCVGLTTAGYTDWYLPARDELELQWRNLKGYPNNNYNNADRQNGTNYALLGTIGDNSSQATGLNNSSQPQGAAYTATVPAVMSVAAFANNGAEQLHTGTVWSSSQYDASTAWYQQFNDGRQYASAKNSTMAVRAVRRSII